MWTFFKSLYLYWICYNTAPALYLGFGPGGMWDLSSPTRDQTHIPVLEGEVLTTGPPGKSQFLN